MLLTLFIVVSNTVERERDEVLQVRDQVVHESKIKFCS